MKDRFELAKDVMKSPTKAAFHIRGRKFLQAMADYWDLGKGSYEIRSCKGGPAVLGEVILHADSIYVQVCEYLGSPMVMYRHCKGQKDYTGGHNNWQDPVKFAAMCRENLPTR